MANSVQPGSGAQPPAAAATERLWTVRIKGVPLDWNQDELQDFMRLDETGFPDFNVRSLAVDVPETSQAATGTTSRPPSDSSFNTVAGLRFELQSEKPPRRYLTVDVNFLGLTSLYTPKPADHKIDVVAISGIGSHAFGSFQERGGEHMWLRDDLPFDLTDESVQKRPIAATLLYGYDSRINQSNSFQVLDDLGNGLRDALRQVVAGPGNRRIILIGHSLGGLVIKQALIAIASSDATLDVKLKTAIYGFAFFGTPHEGMEVKSLLLMAQDGPNRPLVEMLDRDNLHTLTALKEAFPTALQGFGPVEVVCYYETIRSPTAKQDASGKWSMNGDPEVLVTQVSATSSGWHHGSEYNCPIARTHSELVKFTPNDHDYANVRTRLREMSRQSLGQLPKKNAKRKLVETDAEAHSVFTYNRNQKGFFGREEQIRQLQQRIHPLSFPHDCQRTAVFGLGGIGKTRLAIETLHRLQDDDPNLRVFWVTTTDRTAFEASYYKIGTVLGVKELHTGSGAMGMVKTALEDQKEPWLLVVDNADDKTLLLDNQGEGDERQVKLQEYLPYSLNGSILFTTRERQLAINLSGTHDPQSILGLEGLPHDDAVRFLVLNLSARQKTETESIDHLVALFDHLPLAIRQAAAYLSEDPDISVSEYLMWCQESDDDIIELLSHDFEDEHRHVKSGNAVAKTWLISLKRIEKSSILAVSALRSIAYLAEKNIPISLLFDQDIPKRAQREALKVLKSHAFVSQHVDSEVFDVHRLVRIVARNWVRQSEVQQRASIVLRQVEHFNNSNGLFGMPTVERMLDKASLPYYDESVTRPITLVMIQSQVEGRKYQTMEDFMRDLHLLFENAEASHKGNGSTKELATGLQEQLWIVAKQPVERNQIEMTMRRFNKVAPAWFELLADLTTPGLRKDVSSFLPHAEMLLKVGSEWTDGDVEPLRGLLSWTGLAYGNGFWRFSDALRIAERLYLLHTERGQEVPLMYLSRLALTYEQIGDSAQAEPLYHELWQVALKLDANDEERWAIATKVASFLMSRGDLNDDENEETLEIAREILELTVKSAPSISSIDDLEAKRTFLGLGLRLATAYRLSKYFEEAEDLLKDILEEQRHLFGLADPGALLTQRELAWLYLDRGCNSESEAMFKESIDIMESQADPNDNPWLHAHRCGLAEVWYDQGRRGDALLLMRASISSLNRLMGDSGDANYYSSMLQKWNAENQ